MTESAGSARRVNGAYRKAEALRLRARGATFREIAQQVGYTNPGTAHETVMGALADLGREEAEELRALELHRLDELHRAVWSSALEGNLAAVDRVLKIMERRAKLCGLDEQTLTVESVAEPSGPTLGELFDIDPERARRLARVLYEADVFPQRDVRPHGDAELN